MGSYRQLSVGSISTYERTPRAEFASSTAVDPNNIRVDVLILRNMARQFGELCGIPDALWEWHMAFNFRRISKDWCIEKPRRDRNHANTKFGKFTGQGQSHADNGRLRSRICRLACFTFERGTRRSKDNETILVVRLQSSFGNERGTVANN